MKKKYNIFIISRLYLKNYYKYLVNDTNVRKSDDAYSLFMYSIKKLYELDVIEYNSAIEKYGKECIEVLRNTPDTPKGKDLKSISFEDRIRIVSICEGYAKALGLLTYEAIVNGRL